MSSTIAFILSMAGLAIILVAVVYNHMHGSLDIKAKTVGDGQYGKGHWATQKEKDEAFQIIPFEPERWRKGQHLPN